MPGTGRPKITTIIEEALVSRRLDASKREYPKLPQMFEAVKWRLARNPFTGATRVPNTRPMRYIIKTTPWEVGMVPALSVVYRVTENNIFIEAFAVRDEY